MSAMETNTTFTTTTSTTPTPTATASTTDAKVQRVTKKSSDELLRKFAEVGTNEKKELRLIKRRKKMKENQSESSSNGSTTVVERRSLLPATVSRKSVLRQLRVRDNRNKSSLLGTIHKTWRRTVEGASRVFMEKHYNRHKRLINDIV